MRFDEFPLSGKTLNGIKAAGFETPLPIQVKVIPAALEMRDIVACAPTGTGKTAAFLIPIMEGLLEMKPRPVRFRPRALAVLPTRELAQQVGAHFRVLTSNTKLKAVVLHGGTEIGREEVSLNDNVDLLVATPGRLLDHLSRGGLKLSDLRYLVIDEADRLFDAGFLPELRRILDALPERRQTMLFSATMPPEMEQFARVILSDPERIQVGGIGTKDTIEESFWPVPDHQKIDLLKRVLSEETNLEKVLVFVRTRAKAHVYTSQLGEIAGLPAAELHSELSQTERTRTLEQFREGTVRLLVATDVAARGLDIQGVSHVINVDVPNTPDDYIHRAGRTGRLDRPGVAMTLVAPEELAIATAIEAAQRRRIPVKRVPGFPYDVEPGGDVYTAPQTVVSRKTTAAKPLKERKFSNVKKVESPFTKSGKLKQKHQDPAAEEDKPRRHGKKRAMRRAIKKKLPHQRKR